MKLQYIKLTYYYCFKYSLFPLSLSDFSCLAINHQNNSNSTDVKSFVFDIKRNKLKKDEMCVCVCVCEWFVLLNRELKSVLVGYTLSKCQPQETCLKCVCVCVFVNGL